MAARDFSVAAAIGILVLICILGAASGLEIPHYTEYARMYKDPPAKRFGYPPGRFIVIDLGNTNSCVAGYGGGPGKADDAVFQFCIPSWVAFTDAGTTLVGDAAQKHAQVNPENAIFGFKRLLGLSRNNWYDGDIVQRAIDRAPYKIGLRNGIHPCVEVKANDGTVKQLGLTKIASVVVAELKAKAERHLGREVRRAVVTIPQHFHGPSTRTAIAASRFAGLVVDDGDTVSEPIAAAVAYGLHRKLRGDGGALVLRVGGGTADASVVTFWDGSLEIIGHEDDSFLGGDDFDQRIVDHFVELIKTKHGRDVGEDTAVLRKLRTACERAKKALSSQDRVQVRLESLFDGVDFSETLLRSEFEELNEDLFGKVIALVERAVVRAKLEKNKRRIDDIVLVGGSTMIPKIQKLVKDYFKFNGKEPNIRVKPDEAIALGAAVLVPTPSFLKLLSLE